MNNLQEPLQSAYKQLHSTETALLKVQDHILRNLDQGKGVVLLLLDLSAAFDTVDHGLLLKTLETTMGIKGQCLQWLTSYLEHRQQSVSIGGVQSTSHTITCGVPHGSVLGPLLFTIYTTPLAAMLRHQDIYFHLYADDTHLFLEFNASDTISVHEVITKLEGCVASVRGWMQASMLKLNEEKTELLIILPRSAQPCTFPIAVGDAIIQSSECARNLGVTFDHAMSLQLHVDSLCRSTFYQLHRIGRIRRYLDVDSTKRLVHALVLSRLDSCNSLLYGLPQGLISKLQRVQNACARIILCRDKYAHLTPMFLELHWLPVELRIQFKILVLAFKCIHGQAPVYLSDLVTVHNPVRSLRSANRLLLDQPGCRTKARARTFSYAAAFLWNKLPLSVRRSESVNHFKTALKTFLFKDHFGV